MGQSTPIKRRASVLLVEDEWLISHMVAQALTDWGFSVHSVSNAEDALDWINSGSAVDLLFTDNLPGSMDGTALAMRVRELRPDLPVVYASGAMNADSLRQVPGATFVPKPYSPSDICAVIARLTAPRRDPKSTADILAIA
jgi:DNA-binding NtrC family response regulator